MDIQLQQLLETIKTEGVDAAEKKAAEIISAAEKKAQAIVAEAEEKADKILEQAKQAAEQREAAAKAAVHQAGRDTVLTIEKQLKEVFGRLVTQTVGATYQHEVLEAAILEVVRQWTADVDGATVILNPEQAKALEESLKAKLSEQLSKGIRITPSSKVSAGFILKQEDGAAYYDFTAEAIAEVLATHLNPALAEIIKG
ncbi:MAG TPA: V-type ATP synthase subunit E [Firmicutes bacterium]|jgi:V/A-type H+-transporting ATPase subunit E|nr:V-type ATP synthase subunit E [Bacillota bacterium]